MSMAEYTETRVSEVLLSPPSPSRTYDAVRRPASEVNPAWVVVAGVLLFSAVVFAAVATAQTNWVYRSVPSDTRFGEDVIIQFGVWKLCKSGSFDEDCWDWSSLCKRKAKDAGFVADHLSAGCVPLTASRWFTVLALVGTFVSPLLLCRGKDTPLGVLTLVLTFMFSIMAMGFVVQANHAMFERPGTYGLAFGSIITCGICCLAAAVISAYYQIAKLREDHDLLKEFEKRARDGDRDPLLGSQPTVTYETIHTSVTSLSRPHDAASLVDRAA